MYMYRYMYMYQIRTVPVPGRALLVAVCDRSPSDEKVLLNESFIRRLQFMQN